MNRVTRFITARRISLALILVLAGLMYVSTLVPQEIDANPVRMEQWRRNYQGLLWFVDATHAHRMYAQPWFAVIILLAALSLGISCLDQLGLSRKRLLSTGLGGAEEVAASVTDTVFRATARSYRYSQLQSAGSGHLKCVRNPWGYYGLLLLHVGMVLVVVASLFVALTYRQGVLVLVEGQQHEIDQPWSMTEQGLLASPLKLPGALRLDRVTVRFDGKNQPITVTSRMTITERSGVVESLAASINRITGYKGLRIYHTAQYGDAFSITFIDRAGAAHTEIITAQQPVSLEKAGYSDDFSLSWLPYQLSAKYLVDADKKAMASSNPLLTLRLSEGTREIARTSLTNGSSGMLGEYRAELNGVAKWAKLVIVDISGMPVVFAGFAIIILGGLLHYMTPPRELIAQHQQDGSYRVYWKSSAFKEFYMDERDGITSQLHEGTP